MGKLPPDVLKRYLLEMTGAPSSDLLIPPSIGVDFGVVKASGTSLIVSSDPVTGVLERIGRYAVNVSANDVATSGNRPRFIQSVILLPEEAKVEDLAKISSEMNDAARDLGVTIVGGHTELTPGLKRPIVVTTAFAFADSYVTAAGAREGDVILMTKTAGVEGTAILASAARGLEGGVKRRAKAYFKKLSIVEEAVAAYGTGGVHAMHDCTEGGLLGAAYEMSFASGLGFEISERDVPVSEETRAITSRLEIDPLRLISSGTLLLAAAKGAEGRVSRAISAAGSSSTAIGRFTKQRRILVGRDGGREEVSEPPTDELWKVIRGERKARVSGRAERR